MDDLQDVIARIEKASKIAGVAKKTTFTGELEGREVEITILDRGAGDSLRWTVFAETVDGEPRRTAVGNPGGDLDAVIATTHWYQLLPPESRD